MYNDPLADFLSPILDIITFRCRLVAASNPLDTFALRKSELRGTLDTCLRRKGAWLHGECLVERVAFILAFALPDPSWLSVVSLRCEERNAFCAFVHCSREYLVCVFNFCYPLLSSLSVQTLRFPYMFFFYKQILHTLSLPPHAAYR